MASVRKVLLASGEIYHVLNRGVERKNIFSVSSDYSRAIELIAYYRFKKVPLRYSHYRNQTAKERDKVMAALVSFADLRVRLVAFCLMPNHFHFLLRQEKENGISRFMSDFSNSYAKYFNTKYSRIGPLFQGPFKAVRMETDEQLVHVSRYIHLNPVSSFLIPESGLDDYQWSSLREYLDSHTSGLCDSRVVLDYFSSSEEYKIFVHNQVEYAKQLESIKHLTFEE